MGYLFLLFVFMAGVLVLLNISFSFSKLELMACGFPIGFGLWSICMMVGDLIGLPIGEKYVAAIIVFICIASLLLRLYFNKKIVFQDLGFGWNDTFKRIKEGALFYGKNPLKINVLYVFIILLVSFIVFSMIVKALYWPVISYDSINGFDFLAKLIKEENTLNSSIFSKENPSYSVRSLYPPLLVHALSIGYIFEMAHSKMVSVVYLLSTVLVLYSFIKKENKHVVAAVGVLLLCITTDFMAFSSLTSSNTIAACYILIGLASYDRWFRKSENHYFFLSVLALSLAVWTRTEAIMFAVAIGITLLFKVWKTRDYKMILLAFVPLLPFLFWQFYLQKFMALESAQPIITHLYWDGSKMVNMLHQMYFIISQEVYFAYTFKIMLLLFIGNLIFFFKDKRMLPLSLLLVTSFLLTIFVYYQIDTSYSTFSESGWIGSGFKRGLFYFIPIGCYYMANSFLMRKLLG